MRKNIRALLVPVGCSVFVLSTLRAQDAKVFADNLKYSRDFYSKVHLVAIANLPSGAAGTGEFKYDRYPNGGPERIQSADGTYLRRRGQSWKHVDQRIRMGLPIDYAEHDRYVMTFASKDDWGRFGDPVESETARKLDGWIKFIGAAFNSAPATMKLADKSESERGAQWIFETVPQNPNEVPTRFTFRKPISDKNENVLLHEFSGSMRLEGDNVVPGGAPDRVRLGFGYMMRVQQGDEVSEFVWEEMQQHSEGKRTSP